MIILLGPTGAGKTRALESIQDNLGWGTVHASFDFDQNEPVTTIEVLTRLAYDLSRKWRHRTKPKFIRFAVALIAIQTPLDGEDPEQDKEKLRGKLNEFRRNMRTERLADMVGTLADPAADVLPPPFATLFKVMVPRLIRAVGRRRLGRAMRSLADFPQSEGASPMDALVALNRLAQRKPLDVNAVTAWLAEAFLADVRENHRRMSVPDLKSPCDCVNPNRIRHRHNWVLLLDNVDHPGGADFLADLNTARDAYRRLHPGDRFARDPLLVIGTSGRWQTEWEPAWRPPWRPDSGVLSRSRPVPACHAADYDHWAKPAAGFHPSVHYPVLLDPLPISEIARIMGASPADPRATLVQRATGGLPAAVGQLAKLLNEETVRDGARDALGADGSEDPRNDPWYLRLTALGLTDQIPHVHVDDFVTAAPFATAPWLIPTSATSRINQPHVGGILTELRTSFWVTAPADGSVTADHVVLHPWIGANLVSALAHRAKTAGPSYGAQFTALRDNPDTDGDPVRRAYCELALGHISVVVDLFETDFDESPHQDWIDRITLVAHAPDNQPLDHTYRQLYEKLVNTDIARRTQGRTEIRNNVTRLIAASWLAANPFAVRGRDQNNDIANACRSLARVSRRPDVSALYEAADAASRGLLP